MTMPPESQPVPLWLAGKPHPGTGILEVRDKYLGTTIARVAMAGGPEIEAAIQAAVKAAPALAALPVHRRQAILAHCIRRFEQLAEEWADLLCAEAGKPIQEARGEVVRLIDTFRFAHSEVLRPMGEVLAMDATPRAEGYRGFWKRVPIGPVAFITPFNFPLNLVAHKVAPALAVGCPFVLKPASLTPLGALHIGAILAETDLPEGAFSVLPCDRDHAGAFTTDERFKLLSFTGSPSVGWDLKNRAGKKKVVLELGGNAAVVIDETADWENAVERIVTGAFANAGQSCISVQRVLVHQSRWDVVRSALVLGAKALCTGDPHDPSTQLGPLISAGEAARVEAWILDACAQGARILCGGTRAGALMAATVLEGVPRQADLYRKEAFGPVVLLEPFEDFEEALERVNDSDFGLQAGVFTRRLDRAHRAWDGLEVGAVVIGDVPSWRVDHMPYGGVKDSGFGREGVRFAMEDMTELRLMVVRDA